MRILLNILFITVFTLVVFIACDDTGITDAEIPDSDISYSLHIQRIFDKKCAIDACHNSAYMAGGYSMSSWTETNKPPYVLAGDPDHSLAYLATLGQAGLSPMPPQDPSVPIPPLTEKESNAFKTWIKEGAKNN